MIPITYKAVWKPDNGDELLIVLGEAKGWVDDIIGDGQFTLVPNDIGMPTLTTKVFDGEFDYLSRVVGNTDVGELFRLYHLGGAWVYPNGTVEIAPQPSFVPDFIRHFMEAIRAAS